MSIVGPGASQETEVEVRPTLEGASEYEYITILNPLTDDFAIRVAQDIPVNMPLEIKNKTSFVKDESDLVRNYGLDLKNPDHKAKKYITNDTVIKAGQTINLKGNEAQVAVRQLVNEIAQREGKRRLLADPTVRKKIEERIIIGRGSIQDLMDTGLKSPRTQINEAINQSNEVNNEESEFPGLVEERDNTPSERGTETPEPSPAPEKRTVGRPRKA